MQLLGRLRHALGTRHSQGGGFCASSLGHEPYGAGMVRLPRRPHDNLDLAAASILEPEVPPEANEHSMSALFLTCSSQRALGAAAFQSAGPRRDNGHIAAKVREHMAGGTMTENRYVFDNAVTAETCACVPITSATWGRCTPPRRRLGAAFGGGRGRFRPGRGCDDSRLVGLKLIFLIVSRTMSLLRLSRRESWWKDAEILMLRHLSLGRPPRAAACSFATDVAGPGVAGGAGRDAAGRLPRRDAAHRHSRHCLALASRHRPSAPVAPRSLRGVRQCAALCGRWCCGWLGFRHPQVDVTGRIKRRQVVHGLISEYRRAPEEREAPAQRWRMSFGAAQGRARPDRPRLVSTRSPPPAHG